MLVGVVVEGNREGSWREQLCLLTPFYQTGVAPPPWLPQGLLPPVALTTDTGLSLSCEPQRSRWRGEEAEGGAAFPDPALAAAVCFRCITRWSLERSPWLFSQPLSIRLHFFPKALFESSEGKQKMVRLSSFPLDLTGASFSVLRKRNPEVQISLVTVTPWRPL